MSTKLSLLDSVLVRIRLKEQDMVVDGLVWSGLLAVKKSPSAEIASIDLLLKYTARVAG